MYLFKGERQQIIPVKCKLCLEEIKFEITADEYSQTRSFPIIKESIHGEPKHKLVVHINKNLEIEDFKIKNLKEDESIDTAEIPQEITNKVLRNLGLTNDEIELYSLTAGRDIVSLGEMALLVDKPKEECKKIANKFIEKGLYKEIIGATPHYAPLPPYAALIGQLKEFYTFISEIKKNMPEVVEKSFSEFETSAEDKAKIKETEEIIRNIKEKMLKQVEIKQKPAKSDMKGDVKNVIKDLGDFGNFTDSIVQQQIEEMKKQFEKINSKATDIIQAQVTGLRDQLNNMKSIIAENLKKLRLGVLQSTIGKSIENVVSKSMNEIQEELNVQLSVNEMVFTDELNDIIENFDEEFTSKIQNSVENTLSQLDGMDLNVGKDQQALFENLGSQFNQALKIAEEKINETYSDVFQSFDSIKDLFTNRVVRRIDDTLNKILDRLQLQEKVTQKFWDQAKKKSTFTMHDIWFIHSPEAAKAHINEEISRAKLRILIVAPEITDIDLESIKSCPSHVNIRIATSINKSAPMHKQIIDELDDLDNVDYRNRKLQNLWGINRDYEEVVLCVISKKEGKGREQTEIAGIGSIIEEHIKIFVPILEEAWMGAIKSYKHKIDTSTQQQELSKKEIPTPKSKFDKVKAPQKKSFGSKKLERPQIKEKLKKPIKKEISSTSSRTPPRRTQPKPKLKPTPQPVSQKRTQSSQPEKAGGLDTTDLEDLPLFEQLHRGLERIQDNINTLKRAEVASALNDFYKKFVKNVGFTKTSKNMHKKVILLESMDKELDKKEKKDLKDLIDTWKASF
jgi:hypothetical protein